MNSIQTAAVYFMGAVLCLSGTVLSGPVYQLRSDKKEIRQDRRELGSTNVTYNQISSTVDKWVEANLAADERRAKHLESTIMQLIDEDILNSAKTVQRAETEQLRSRQELNRAQAGTHDRRDDRRDLRDDHQDVRQIKSLLESKKIMAENIRRSTAFSNKYRLLGDYLELLRRESGKVKTELAEDRRELREDRVGK